MKWRYYIDRAKRLEQKLHDLQFEIYSFSSELKDEGLKNYAALAGASGFELDAAHQKMNELMKDIEGDYSKDHTEYVTKYFKKPQSETVNNSIGSSCDP